MQELILIVLWILITLGVSSSACIMGVRYGSAFPISIMGALVTIAAVAANKIVMVGNLAVPGGIIVASTIASQLIDSAIFLTIAFYGVMPIGQMILNIWLVKIAIALLDTPFIYFVRWITLKAQSREGFQTQITQIN